MLEKGGVAKLAPNIVVKVPMSENGLEAMAASPRRGSRPTARWSSRRTRASSAKAGASLISPFVGRLDDTTRTA